VTIAMAIAMASSAPTTTGHPDAEERPIRRYHRVFR
jgi:hypothetical protein